MPAGNYGGTPLNDEQYNNAAIIARTGYGMGATARDVQVALMAAMTESSLRNLKYGDRDSQGLFQQRPSQGWGTIAQVTDPVHASQSFFKALMAVPNRDGLSLQAEAQRVQRSAYADGRNYSPWVSMAGAVVKALGGGAGDTGNILAGSGPGAPAAAGGSGAPAPGDTQQSSIFDSIGSSLSGIASSVAAIGKIALWLTVPSHWTRIISGGFGVAFVFIGIMMIGKEVRA